MAKKKKFTAAQKAAYHAGRGYRAGQNGRKIPYRNKDTLNSFRAGYSSVKNAVKRYPKLDK